MTGAAPNHTSDFSETLADELPAGTTLCFGQYEIVKYLNSGGFGITYLANDSLGRRVVIKECFPGAMCRRAGRQVSLRTASYRADFERVVELFEREARALAQLQHPNIVGVHQIFQDNGTAYMALDFVEGHDLLQVIEHTPYRLGPYEVKRIVFLLLHALAYVHRNGILHRDISPDNILLDNGGSPVLIDFGAAREGATRASRVLSRVHTVKDGYSPQEFYLASGSQEVSSDLYSLAATVYHLITGEPPPNSTLRLAAVAEKHADPYVPLKGRVSGYDFHFLGAVDQCLSVFAKDRLRTAEAWLDMIDEARRQKVLLAKAKEDKEIDLKVSQMISDSLTTPAADDPKSPGLRLAGRTLFTGQGAESPVVELHPAAAQRDVHFTYAPDETATPDPVPAPAKGRKLKRRVSLAVALCGLLLAAPLGARFDRSQPDRTYVQVHQDEVQK